MSLSLGSRVLVKTAVVAAVTLSAGLGTAGISAAAERAPATAQVMSAHTVPSGFCLFGRMPTGPRMQPSRGCLGGGVARVLGNEHVRHCVGGAAQVGAIGAAVGGAESVGIGALPGGAVGGAIGCYSSW